MNACIRYTCDEDAQGREWFVLIVLIWLNWLPDVESLQLTQCCGLLYNLPLSRILCLWTPFYGILSGPLAHSLVTTCFPKVQMEANGARPRCWRETEGYHICLSKRSRSWFLSQSLASEMNMLTVLVNFRTDHSWNNPSVFFQRCRTMFSALVLRYLSSLFDL